MPAASAFLALLSALIRIGRAWRRLLLFAVILGAALAVDALLRAPGPLPMDDGRPDHVLLIGIDGLTTRALGLGNTPNIDFLADEGAQAIKAQAVMPTMSSPNWASLLMGAGPESHGIDSNAWRPPNWAGSAYCGRADGAGWPTLFGVLARQRPGAKSVVVHDWFGIKRLIAHDGADRRRFRSYPGWATRVTKRLIRRHEPTLTFLHLDHVDKAGHAYGFDAWQYHRAVAEADAYVGELLDLLEARGLAEHSLVMIVSDHGGIGRNHGGDTAEELDVPWILWGRGVAAGLRLPGEISVTDTAPTLAYALGLTPPVCWTGEAKTGAFAFQPDAPSE